MDGKGVAPRGRRRRRHNCPVTEIYTVELVRKIHAAPHAAAFVVSGAGTSALAWLMGEAGASATIIDAQVPYARVALDEYVGSRADQHVSAEEAGKMADAAYWRCLRLEAAGRPGQIGSRPALGVACTATIATNRPKRGDHRAHVALRSADRLVASSLTFEKGARKRSGEEQAGSRILLNMLAAACGIDDRLGLDLRESESVVERDEPVGDLLADLIANHARAVTVAADGQQALGAPSGVAVLAGSFDPLHEGHRQLVGVAEELTGRAAVYEISVTNVEKPPLARALLDARIAQLRGVATVVVTRAPTFDEKSALIKDAVFVVGHDTAVRLFDERFYAPREAASEPEGEKTASGSAMAEVRRNGGSFLVAGRMRGDRFLTLDDIAVPAGFEDMLAPVPEARFRADTSSTAIREGPA